MKKITMHKLFFLGCLIVLIACESTKEKEKKGISLQEENKTERLNVLLITADDLNKNSVGAL